MNCRIRTIPHYNFYECELTALRSALRIANCECERGNEPSIAQALHLLNSPETGVKIRHRFGTARELAESELSEQQIIEELYLRSLARYPRPKESELMQAAFLTAEGDRRNVVEDLLWALLNTREFVFNH